MTPKSPLESPTFRPSRGLPRWVEAPAALAGLILLSPLLAAAAVAVRLTSPGPILFRQERVGKGGEPFRLVKFRSMVVHDGGSQITAGGDRRITTVGRVLRTTKIDELPTLWNVLRGEMALVGPRPEVPRYVDHDDPRWQAVLTARPGLTDPVTLQLRNEEALLAGVEDREAFYRQRLLPYKLEGYREYLERRTPWSDLKVIAATALGIVLPRRHPPPEL